MQTFKISIESATPEFELSEDFVSLPPGGTRWGSRRCPTCSEPRSRAPPHTHRNTDRKKRQGPDASRASGARGGEAVGPRAADYPRTGGRQAGGSHPPRPGTGGVVKVTAVGRHGRGVTPPSCPAPIGHAFFRFPFWIG